MLPDDSVLPEPVTEPCYLNDISLLYTYRLICFHLISIYYGSIGRIHICKNVNPLFFVNFKVKAADRGIAEHKVIHLTVLSDQKWDIWNFNVLSVFRGAFQACMVSF